MKYSIAFANTGPFVEPLGAIEFAQAAEAAGFESIWTVEHVVVPEGYESTYPYDRSGRMPGNDDAPIPDPLIWLAFLASATSTIKLGTGVLIVPQRNPLVLAKELATLDVLSGGRMLLGVGAGWLAEEFRALGVSFEDRGSRLDDSVAAMRALWQQPTASYDGVFSSFENCIMRPQPVSGTIPVHVGGHTTVAAKRAGRIGDGFFPAEGNHEKLANLIGIARQTAEDAGRDPDALEITTGGKGVFGPNAIEEAAALEALGVHRVIVPSFLFWNDTATALAQYGSEVIAKI